MLTTEQFENLTTKQLLSCYNSEHKRMLRFITKHTNKQGIRDWDNKPESVYALRLRRQYYNFLVTTQTIKEILDKR